MSKTIYPPGDKVQKAIRELSELLQNEQKTERKVLLQKVIMKYDLTPKESDFFIRHFTEM